MDRNLSPPIVAFTQSCARRWLLSWKRPRIAGLQGAFLALILAAMMACGDALPTSTPTAEPTIAPTATPTASSSQPTATPTAEVAPTAAAPDDPLTTPEEGMDWTPCGSGLECGFLEVPADYRDSGSGTILIAVNVHRATSPDDRIGYLLVNPGGPGESGVELVSAVPFGVVPDEIVSRFDIVGFDPRGVAASEPSFACGDPGEQLALLSRIEGAIDTADELASGEQAAALCVESMGPVGGLLHSAYVARDMDEIRKALGVDRISYLGFSYGSALGVWYATLFPDSVRAMVVDGAANPVKPVATQQERVDEEIKKAATFEEFLEKALGACADPECPIYNEGDPSGYFLRAAEKLHLVNAAAADNPQAGALGIISTLYSEETWPYLWQGLFELEELDDPSILLEFAGFQLGPEPGAASFTAHVNCLDGWALHPELDRSTRLEDVAISNAAIADQFPLIAATNPFSAEVCHFYDQFAPDPLDGPLDGGGVAILVVGNHGDPFTSFRESEELAIEVLRNGYLVEATYPAHIVYPNEQCVVDHVHRALIDGQLPSDQRVVHANRCAEAPLPQGAGNPHCQFAAGQ